MRVPNIEGKQLTTSNTKNISILNDVTTFQKNVNIIDSLSIQELFNHNSFKVDYSFNHIHVDYSQKN